MINKRVSFNKKQKPKKTNRNATRNDAQIKTVPEFLKQIRVSKQKRRNIIQRGQTVHEYFAKISNLPHSV